MEEVSALYQRYIVGICDVSDICLVSSFRSILWLDRPYHLLQYWRSSGGLNAAMFTRELVDDGFTGKHHTVWVGTSRLKKLNFLEYGS
jgi:hypothetical protein